MKLKILLLLSGIGSTVFGATVPIIVDNNENIMLQNNNMINDMFDDLNTTSEFDGNDQTFQLLPYIQGGIYKLINSTGNLSISKDGVVTLPGATSDYGEYILNFSYITKSLSADYSFSWILKTDWIPDVVNLTNTTFYDGKIQTFNGLTPTITGGEYTRVSADPGIDIALDGTITLDATALPKDYNLKFTYTVDGYTPVQKDFVWHLNNGNAPDVTNLTNTTSYDGKTQTFSGLNPTIAGGIYTKVSADPEISVASDGTISLVSTAKPKDYNLKFTYKVDGYELAQKDFVWHLNNGNAPDVTNLTNTTFYDGKIQTFNGLTPTIAGGTYITDYANVGISIATNGIITLDATAQPRDYNISFTYSVSGYQSVQKNFVWHLDAGVAPDVTNLTKTTSYNGKTQTFDGLVPSIKGGIYVRTSGDVGINITSDGTITLDATALPKDYNLKFTYKVDGYELAQKDFVWHLNNGNAPDVTNLTSTTFYDGKAQTFNGLTPTIAGGIYTKVSADSEISIASDGKISLASTAKPKDYNLKFTYTVDGYTPAQKDFVWHLNNGNAPDVTNLANTTTYTGKVQTFNGLKPTIDGGTYTRTSGDTDISIASNGIITLASTAKPNSYNLKFTYTVTGYTPVQKDFTWYLNNAIAPDVTNLTNTSKYNGKAQTFNGLTPTILGGVYGRISADAGIDIASDGTITLAPTALPKKYEIHFFYLVDNCASVEKDFVWNLNNGNAPDVTNLDNTTDYNAQTQTFNSLTPTITGGEYTRVSADPEISIASDGTITLAATAQPKDYNLKFTYKVDGYEPVQKNFVWHLKPTNIDGTLLTTDGTKITFNSSNTPMSNFCSQIGDFVINGQSISRTKIVSVSFGKTYSEITKVDDNWFWGCSSLTSINFSGLANLASVGNYWLYKCKSLTSVDFSPLSNLVSVGNEWLNGCSTITSVNFSKLSKLESVGDDWLISCSMLQSVTFKDLVNLSSVKNNWLADCTSLTSIDFNGLTKLTTVGDNWLLNCTSLTSVDFSAITNLTSVRNSWLYGCIGLTSINFGALTNLSTIGYEWLSGCTSLTSIDFSKLINLSSIGDNWLSGCTSLNSISVGNISWIPRKMVEFVWVGFSDTNFASNCSNSGDLVCSSTDIGNGWKNGGTLKWNIVTPE